ncbi:Alpha-ketoglutarate-dependent dioxygenase AlkB-like [Trypanosoma melophagium]|uniref:Alpha-ketoglutarate-dependent dioxygenase AlkB-like n=1 Tax=Trypanosoma melophagium TaxID=715481 RepID=UPI003519F796|nr:Alpha-ketoglutarate-dependent dioxygenase AlkB-like [Trypanosoma melophagium]
MDTSSYEDLALTPFRCAEKHYKLYRQDRRTARRHKLSETDFTDVVDFRTLEANTKANRALIREVKSVDESEVLYYTFDAIPGLLVFPAALTEADQQQLCRDAVLKYGDSRQHPNHLSTHASNPQQTKRYTPPMRWATLGFSYNWTLKTYSREQYSPFPYALKERIEKIVSLLKDKNSFEAAYEPQTSIVNYFPVGAMMMAHQDVSEESLQQPLISLSLGCSCVFLMGTASRDEAPYAFWLRSGDIAVFSGPAREAYHAVPRIMDDCPSYLWKIPQEMNNNINNNNNTKDTERECEIYWREQMQHMRININVRQVYDDSCEYLFK